MSELKSKIIPTLFGNNLDPSEFEANVLPIMPLKHNSNSILKHN